MEQPPAETIRHQILDALCLDLDDNLLFADGFDDCILGVCDRFNDGPLLLYDLSKMIEKLMRDGLTYDEAIEHYDFNIRGAWVGDQTPVFARTLADLGVSTPVNPS